MNILYDHQIFRIQKYGGISRYFYELIRRMTQLAEVHFYHGLYVNEYSVDSFKNQLSGYCGFKRPLIPKTGKALNYLSDIYFNYIYIKRNHFDIYHPTYYYLPTFNCKGAKIITVHDLIHEVMKSYFPANDKTIEQKKMIFKDADGFICISESTKKDLIAYYDIPEELIKVIYLANSLSNTRITKRLIEEPYILYVGQRSGYKNFKVLVDAYMSSLFIKNNFQLVCFGTDNFSREELDLFRKYNLESKTIHVSGDDAVLSNLYSNACVFVCTSLYEGFGIPPLEAMHHGCPCIVSKISSIPEVVGDAGLFYNPESSDDLREMLEKLLSSKKLREDLVTKGYNQEKKYCWNKCATETMSFYNYIRERYA